MMKNFYTLIVIAVLFVSCGGESADDIRSEDSVIVNIPPPIDTMKWLIGTWENKNENGVMTETWTQEEDSALTGIVTATYYFMDENMKEPELKTDTLETIRIEQFWGKLSYIPAVKDQNNGMPVKFKMTSCGPDTFVFENPEHDFPQKIMYERFGEDSLVATVSGVWKNENVKDVFPMKRTN